jgi:membrane protease YdiL (CAAX protease family)
MAAWTAFGAVVAVVLAALLALSYLTQQGLAATPEETAAPEAPANPGESQSPDSDDVTVGDGPTAPEPTTVGADRDPADASAGDAAASARDAAPASSDDRRGVGTDVGAEGAHDADADPGRDDDPADPVANSPAAETLTTERELSGGVLLANVAASQGTFAVVLGVAALATGVPGTALGLSPSAFGPGPLLAGVALGVALSAGNQGAVHLFRRFDVAFSEELRELLAPSSSAGWAALLLGALPLVAVFEELLFRAALIGAFAAGFGVNPWLLVVGSSVLFAAGHGAQGLGGVVVTGALGLVLGAAFVVTDSLATVVVAHYLVNALEFVVHER